MYFFQIVKLGLEIFEILLETLLQYEIPSINFFLLFSWSFFRRFYSIKLGNISSIYDSLEQICRDTAPSKKGIWICRSYLRSYYCAIYAEQSDQIFPCLAIFPRLNPVACLVFESWVDQFNSN